MMLKKIFMTILLLGISFSVAYADDAAAQAEKEKVAAIADQLHSALRKEDEATVQKLLHKDVMILEGGHAQKSRAEYMAGHMKLDMKFLPHVTSTLKNRKVSIAGDLAWVVTHSHILGEYNGQKIDRPSRGMLVLKKENDQWQITLVHWGKD